MSRNQQTADGNSGNAACYCAAHGCPLLGTVSASTTGGSDWWCFLHFGKDAVRLQAITVEINRREWLAKITTDIRMHYGTERWPDVFRAIQHELSMQTRNDLHFGKAEKERAVWQWLRRLEGELQSMVSATFTKPPKQTRMQAADEPFQKVEFDLPQAGA